MKILVTGSAGRIGSLTVALLRESDHEVVELDTRYSQDVCDRATVQDAARDCNAIIHLAVRNTDNTSDHGAETRRMIAIGMQNILDAAESEGMIMVVFASSVNVYGRFSFGDRPPVSLPIDEMHPVNPCGPYSEAKYAAEQQCALFTRRTGIPTICLRFPATLTPAELQARGKAWVDDPESEWWKRWEYGAYLDARDAARAALAAVMCRDPGHVALLACATNIATTARFSSRQLAQLIFPNVPWKGGPEFDDDRDRALVSSEKALAVLGWSAQHRWFPRKRLWPPRRIVELTSAWNVKSVVALS